MKVKFQMSKQKEPQKEKGIQVAYGEAKRSGYRLRWFALLMVVTLPIALVGYYLLKPQVFTIAQGIVTYEPISLNAPRDSVLESRLLHVGDSFFKGQFIVQLRNTVLEDEITFLQKEIKGLEAYSAQRGSGISSTYAETERQAERNLQEIAKIKAEFEKLNEEGLVSTGDYASILNNYYSAQTMKSRASLDFELARRDAEDETHVGDVANIIRSLKQDLSLKLSHQRELLISAPFDGYVIDVLAERGQRLVSNMPVVTIAPNTGQVKVVAYLDAKHSDKALLDRKVTIKLPNGIKLNAHVSSPTELASKLPIQLSKPFEGQKALLEVFLTIDAPVPPREKLIQGMPVEVYF